MIWNNIQQFWTGVVVAVLVWAVFYIAGHFIRKYW